MKDQSEFIQWWKSASERERDAKVAELVMGLPVFYQKDFKGPIRKRYQSLTFPCVFSWTHLPSLILLNKSEDFYAMDDDGAIVWNPTLDLNKAADVEAKAIELFREARKDDEHLSLKVAMHYCRQLEGVVPNDPLYGRWIVRASASDRCLAACLLVMEVEK